MLAELDASEISIQNDLILSFINLCSSVFLTYFSFIHCLPLISFINRELLFHKFIVVVLTASVRQDYSDTEMLLSGENVNQEALLCYAREAADFGTNYQLPTLDFAMNHCGQPDVAMFDFTNMYASENAALVRERFGHQLLVALVGDSLLEVRQQVAESGIHGMDI